MTASRTPLLAIDDLHVTVEGKQILNGLTLQVRAGEVHAIMGPNGSGKSTLAHVLAGRPGYEITAGTVSYEGRDLLALAPEERARQGVFLGFQYPVEIPGVNNVYLLKAGVNAVRKQRGLPEVDAFEFLGLVRDKMKLMHIEDSFLSRGVNEGFSGGEKKRNEVLQMLVLEPRLAILDETDSGLDIHALKVVDVESGVGFVENRQSRLEHEHLQHFVALLLAARETLVHAAGEEAVLYVHEFHLVAHQPQEFEGVDFGQATLLAHGVDAGLQQIHVVDSGDLDRVLEAEKYPLAGTLLGGERQQVAPLVAHRAGGDLIAGTPGAHVRERTLARAVRSHDGVHFARPHLEREPVQDLLALDGDVQIVDGEEGGPGSCHVSPPRLPGSRPAGLALRPRIPSAAP